MASSTDQKPWLAQYPKGVPVTIDTEKYGSVNELVQVACKKHAAKTAFSCMGKSLIFREIDELSTAFGAYLHYRGLQPGDRIALMMPNILQYPIALFGALKAGLIIVNTNPLYTPREMRHQFTDAAVSAIIIAENFASNLQKIIGETSIKIVITTSLGELLGFPKKQLVNFVVRRIKKLVPAYQLQGDVSFSQALAEGRGKALPVFESCAADVIALQYTGGTTGVSKGAMLTNGNIVANTLQAHAWLSPFSPEGTGAMLCPLPLYHIFAFTVNALALFSHGVNNVLITNPRDLSTIVKAFKDYQISGMTGVNTLFNALINHPDFRQLDFSQLKLAVGGGTAVQQPVAEAWQKLTGVPLSEGYGLTEASPSVSMNPLDGRFRLGSIGLPLPNTEVRIWLEDEKRPGLAGEVGELQVKGPQIMKGYYQRPDETAKTIQDGWLCTGDIATMMEDGFLKIVDRKKDMILVSGFNVFPNEIEEVLAGHPKILELAAIGVPNEKSGEAVKVFVVKKDPSLTEKEVADFARENLTGYKVPKEIAFIEELPKSPVGKILRRHLRE